MRADPKPNVLLLQNRIATYRKEVYEEIAKHVNLTVGYTDKDELNGTGAFNRIQLSAWKIKSLQIQKPGFFKLCAKHDVVIFVGDMHNLSFCALPFIPGKFKTIAWTIGIRASYTRPYDTQRKHDLIDRIYGHLLSACNACIFYTKAPIDFWGSIVDKNKIFVAHNTVFTAPLTPDYEKKKNILFIGTLYKGKGVEQIIESYIRAKNTGETLPILDIVGDGVERPRLESLTQHHSLDNVIRFHGAIYDEAKLAEIFQSAIICISPNQAGLSVLKSMGYGVPFATTPSAITGGEILNIKHGINGILYKDSKELDQLIKSTNTNPNTFHEMGMAAKKWYEENATISQMANGVISAIRFVLSHQS